MAVKTVNARYRHPCRTAAQWSSSNPVLLAGEVGYESDTGKSKVGDGVKKWSELGYTGTDKVDKVSGKGLSTNDYSTAEKNKLAGIAAGANNYIHPSTHPASMITGLPTSLPASGGNSTTADKLKTPRSIALTGGATGTATNFDGSANISIPVTGLNATNLTTGTVPTARMSGAPGAYNINPALAASGVLRANVGTPTLAEMALVEQEFTNKIAFYPYANGLCEVSSNGGTTWTTDTSVTETVWKKLMCENNEASIKFTPDKQYRITITSKSYCYLNAVYLYLSCAGNKAAIRIEKYNNTTNSWSDVIAKSSEASGWPAHFWFQHSTVAFNTATTATSYCGKVRLTIIPTAVSGYEANSLTFYGLRWYGGYPGTDRRTIYSWDSDKNVTFPAALKASTVYDNGQRVYSPSNKPTPATLGAAPTSHTHTKAQITDFPASLPANGGTASKVSNKLTVGSKTYDGSAAVTITAADLGALTSVPATYVTETEYATASKGGVVKSSTAADKIAVGSDGIMSLNTVSGSKVSGAVASATSATTATTATTANKTKAALTAGSKTFNGSAAVTLTAADVGAAAASHTHKAVYTATLTAAGWSASTPYTQTVTVSGLLAADEPFIRPVLSTTTATAIAQKEAAGCVDVITAAANSITAKCLTDKPTADIPIRIVVIR